jgi:hypothetical protein
MFRFGFKFKQVFFIFFIIFCLAVVFTGKLFDAFITIPPGDSINMCNIVFLLLPNLAAEVPFYTFLITYSRFNNKQPVNFSIFGFCAAMPDPCYHISLVFISFPIQPLRSLSYFSRQSQIL